jgi:hypothetical protein
MIINKVTIPEYGFSKLNMPGFVFEGTGGDTALFIFVGILLQSNSILPEIQYDYR